MAADNTPVKALEAPPLTPLVLKSKLAGTPGKPKYAATIKTGTGKEIVLGCPRATRALVALMDVHAVVGGAACHWGGPAAIAEIMSAVHGLMFATTGKPWHEAYNFVNDAGHTENGIYALRANYGFDAQTFDISAIVAISGLLSVDSGINVLGSGAGAGTSICAAGWAGAGSTCLLRSAKRAPRNTTKKTTISPTTSRIAGLPGARPEFDAPTPGMVGISALKRSGVCWSSSAASSEKINCFCN